MRGVFLFVILSFFSSCLPSFSQGTWVQKQNVFSSGRAGVVGFSIGNKGYFGTGWDYTNVKCYDDFWEWDNFTNLWTQKANFPGVKRGDASGFSIGNFGYICTGYDGGTHFNDFWEWNQTTNIWTQKTSFPGNNRMSAIGFSIGAKGYIGGGYNGITYFNDFWEWDQSTNTWTQKANFLGGNRGFATGFSIGNKGYFGTGYCSTYFNDFWEWDQSTNTWTQKANFPGYPREFAASFSIGTKGFLGTGADVNMGSVYDDFWEWDQATNVWTQKANYPHPACDIDRASFSIGCKGYFGCGASDSKVGNQYFNDFWQYIPDDLPPIIATITSSNVICIGSSILLSANGGTNYLWSTGETSNPINVSPTSSTTYSVLVSNDCVSATANTTIIVVNSGIANFTYQYDPCKNACVQLTDQSTNALTWQWDFGDGNISTSQTTCHTYRDTSAYSVSLIINKSTECTDTFNMVVPFVTHDTTAFVYIPNAFSPNEDGENDSLKFYLLDNYCLKNFEITIYDRWGEQVFTTTKRSDAWDGNFNGKKLDSQTLTFYCKTITATGRQSVRKGNISLVR